MKRKTKLLMGILLLTFTFVNVVYGQQYTAYADTFNTISGTLTDRAGNPIANANFDIMSATTSRALVTTDAGGNYTVNVTPERYGVYADSPIYYGSSQFRLSTTAPLSATQYFIDATNGNVTQNLQFDNVALNVNFVDQNGNPIPNADVFASGFHSNGTTTFAVGRQDITFKDTGGGAFGLSTNISGITTAAVLRGIQYNICAVNPTTNISTCTLFTPTSDLSTLTLVAPPHSTISGILTDRAGNPIANATFTVMSATSSHIVVTTNASGNYSVNVNPEKYGIYLDSPIYYGNSQFRLYNTTASGAQYFIDATSGNVTQNLQFDNVVLNVNFVDQNGNPIPNAAVSVRDYHDNGTTTLAVGRPDITFKGNGGGGAFGLTTNTSGTTASGAVLRGIQYNICVVDPTTGINTCTLFTPTADTSTVTLTAPIHNTISGTFTDHAGNPIANAYFAIMSATSSQVLVTTDAGGNYTVNVAPEKYGVYADSPIYYGNSQFRMYTTSPFSSAQYFIDATSGNVTQNLQFDNVVLNVNFVDQNGNPIPNAAVSAIDYHGTGTTTFAMGRPDVIFTANNGGAFGLTTNASGTATAAVLRGIQYNVCAVDPMSSVQHCVLYTPTVEGTNNLVISEAVKPDAPNGLTSQSTTNQTPSLTWNAVSSVDHYNIYRDGNNVSRTTSTTYTDTGVSEGTHSYYVVAVSGSGTSSDPSSTVNVVYDITAPIITYTVSPTTNSNGWNNSNVTVTFSCSDHLSGVQTCPSPVTVSTDGANQTVGVSVADKAGNTAVVAAANVNIDKTAPTLGADTWTSNPLLQGQNTTLGIPASDSLSGIANVQYAINGGTPQTMTYSSTANAWQATFGSTLPASTYNISITATDKAGNVSASVTDVLAVYTTSNGYVTGHAKTQPITSDTLPIVLDTSNHPAQLVMGFTNVMAPTSGSFNVSYVVKKNMNEFSLSSTSINWVVVQDSTHAGILGKATLTTYVNGTQTVTQNVSGRIDIVLGTNGAPDHVLVKIYNPGVDPNIALPTYVVSDNVIANGSNLMIHP